MNTTATSASQSEDELAIRDLVSQFFAASEGKNLERVRSLLADDVVFMVPGAEPFGKEAFTESAETDKAHLLKGEFDILEIKVLGDWAWMRNHLDIIVRTPDNEERRRSGYTLTVLTRNPDGQWVISRDANLLTLHKEQ